jgi:subtilisin family serine protease
MSTRPSKSPGMWRGAVLAALAMGTLVPLAPAHATARGGVVAGSPIIAVIDTGVRVTHEEFDYRGPKSSDDQVVAWWDFTTDKKKRIVEPAPGQTWDPQVAQPYDDYTTGHGTGVAALAVGLNRTPVQTRSAAPGYRLAVAKVLNHGGTGAAELAPAIRWAVRTVHASVINISIGTIAPSPAVLDADVLDAIDAATKAGIMVVLGNGNGWANAGLPGEPGWATGFGDSTSALAVGAADVQGLTFCTDPELTANSAVHTATNSANDAYMSVTGTSFASPFVAGFAAQLVNAARNAHRDASPGRIRRLIEYSTVDTVRPPQSEGYGEITLAALPAALAHARAGTTPKRPNPDPSGWYVEHVSMKLRDLWSNRLRNP